MIKPTVGRVVWFYSSKAPEQPLAAIVSKVHSDRMVNVLAIAEEGIPYGQTSVQLLQDDDKPSGGAFWCAWMPYQLGQAARTEAAEAKVHHHYQSETIGDDGATVGVSDVSGSPSEALEQVMRENSAALDSRIAEKA